METNYKYNLKRLLWYYPRIYLNDKPKEDMHNYCRCLYINTKQNILVFGIFTNKIITELLEIDISIEELQGHIEQLGRNVKLKEMIQIIND